MQAGKPVPTIMLPDIAYSCITIHQIDRKTLAARKKFLSWSNAGTEPRFKAVDSHGRLAGNVSTTARDRPWIDPASGQGTTRWHCPDLVALGADIADRSGARRIGVNLGAF